MKLFLLLVIVLYMPARGFQPQSIQSAPRSTSKTALYALFRRNEINSVNSYAERRRTLRRDYYTHEHWLKARAKNRFVGTVAKMIESGVVRQLYDEVLSIGVISLGICLWNLALVTGWQGFGGKLYPPLLKGFPLLKLPLEPFTISASALSLLLVFKTNTSYARWDEARKAWGVIVNNSRTVIREAAAWTLKAHIPNDQKRKLIRHIADCVFLFPRSLQRHLWFPEEDERRYNKQVKNKIGQRLPKLTAEIIDERHKPMRALFEMSKVVNTLPLDTIQRTTIDNAVSQLCDASGACERVFSSPVPSVYTRHTSRFLELWILLLPFALWTPFSGTWNNWVMVPASMVISFFFIGIEELSIQLEEPFSVLPLDKIANGIDALAEDTVTWFNAALDEEAGEDSASLAGPGSDMTNGASSES